MDPIRRGRFCTAVVIGVLLAGSAWAQGFGGDVGLLQNPAVQTELKLTDEQKTKVGEVRQKVQAEVGEFVQKLRDATADERAKIVTQVQAIVTKHVNTILNADQQKRLRQISLQQQGLIAVMRPEVADQLKITPEQKTKVQAILQEFGAAQMQLFQGQFSPEVMQKLQALQKQTNDKLTALLTDEQKTKWKEITGTPFTVPPFRRGM